MIIQAAHRFPKRWMHDGILLGEDEPGVSLAEVQAAFDRLNTPPNLHQDFAELRPEVRS